MIRFFINLLCHFIPSRNMRQRLKAKIPLSLHEELLLLKTDLKEDISLLIREHFERLHTRLEALENKMDKSLSAEKKAYDQLDDKIKQALSLKHQFIELQNDLNKRDRYICRELNSLKRSLNIMFKYETQGLELYPYKNQMERILTADYRDAKINHLNRYEFAKSLLNESDEVLDIACSIGYGSDCLQRKVAQVTGVDIFPPAIEYANRVFGRSGAKFICSDAVNTELFTDNSFDAIISFETVEHVADDNLLIENFKKWLRPKGKLILSVPNQEKLPFNPEENIYHERHYTGQEIKSLLEENGFEIKNVYKQDYGEIASLSDSDVEGFHSVIEASLLVKE